MSKLNASDFVKQPIITATDEPCFEGVDTEYIPESKVEKKLPEAVRDVYAKAVKQGQHPMAYKLAVKDKDKTAYAIVTAETADKNKCEVLNKKGHSIVTVRLTSWDSVDD